MTLRSGRATFRSAVAAALLLATQCRSQRIGSAGACPAGVSGAPFVGSPNDDTCTVVTDLNFWDVPAANVNALYAHCTRPEWGLAERGGTAFLYSTAHAKAIGDAIPAGSQALVSLRPSGGTWRWSWTGTGSTRAPAPTQRPTSMG